MCSSMPARRHATQACRTHSQPCSQDGDSCQFSSSTVARPGPFLVAEWVLESPILPECGKKEASGNVPGGAAVFPALQVAGLLAGREA